MKKKNLSAKKKILNFYKKKLKNPKIKKIYLEFKKILSKQVPKSFCVAVSGGADSMALSFLAKCYSIEKKINIYYFIVDHKLREGSTVEANLVKKKLSIFDIDCKILTIKKINKISNLQSFARNNRYELLFKQCLHKNMNFVLTAHHKNDLLENFFIRLLRGSGLKGLTSFGNTKSKIKFDNKIDIFRPLINISQNELKYVSKNTFNFSVDDPSNLNDKFLRIRIRKLISKLEEDGLNFNKFKKSLNNLNKSNYSIDHYVKKNIYDNSNYLPLNKTVILKDDFLKQPDEIVFRSISEVLQNFSKKTTSARGVKVINLINFLRSDNNLEKKTLSGCIFQKIEKSVIISHENHK